MVAKQRRIIAIVEELIREIRPELNPQTLPLAMLFFGMINWTHTWFRSRGSIDSEAIANMATDLFLNGLDGVQAS